jgi:hypothetical protein
MKNLNPDSRIIPTDIAVSVHCQGIPLSYVPSRYFPDPDFISPFTRYHPFEEG